MLQNAAFCGSGRQKTPGPAAVRCQKITAASDHRVATVPLTIIKGPPNSGRTELVRERFEARLADDPVLVVPSTDDIFGWERRLTRNNGAFIGGRVVHFKDLVDEILGDESTARNYGGETGIASPLRRRSLAAAAIEAGWPALAVHLDDQPGLIDAALQAIDEFRENLVRPEAFDDAAVAEAVGPIADVHRRYLALLDEQGLTDLPARAELASARSFQDWQGRPVFVAGFDDMTQRQLDLLRRLAAETEVTVAMTHERGNRAMAVTESLLGRLESIGGRVESETSRPAASPDHDPLLVDLERAFLDRSRDGSLEPGDAVSMIEASGRRGEAEAIGAEIAGLVQSGVDPGEIAIAIDAPAVNGGPILEVLSEYGIPATLEAETKAPETATGQAVLNLLRAGSKDGTAEQFIALLRGPLGLDQGEVDRIEFESRRAGQTDAGKVADRIRGSFEVPGWQALKSGDPATAAREVAETAAVNLVKSGPDGLPGSAIATETQMSTAIRRAIAELEESTPGRPGSLDLIKAISSGAVKTWAVPTAHTVQISSPYSMRAKRSGYLFLASLQEKDLGRGEGSPLMSRDGRSVLGMPDLTDQEEQETYLFYSCLAVPTRSIWLSYRVADVHGKAEFPSPLIGEITRLFVDGGAGLRRIRRNSSDILFDPAEAPSEHEWALATASQGITEPPAGGALNDAFAAVDRANRVEHLTRKFRNIDSPAAMDALAGANMFSATALEAFIECPYRWFFERSLRPARFGPDPDAMAKGNLIHAVLAELYENHPGELPSGDGAEWIAEMASLVKENARQCGLGDDTASHRIQRRQVETELARFLRREADRTGAAFKPVGLEQKFGFNEQGSKPPLEGDGWNLRGAIDRIDQDEDGNGVVLDYKSGPSSYRSLAEIKREGKVQLTLYLKALEELWGLKPAAGLYVPVFAAKHKSRGLVAAEQKAALADIGLFDNDVTDDLAAEIEEGFQKASTAARKILRGEIAHDPSECLNHFHHAGVPDWVPGNGEGGPE